MAEAEKKEGGFDPLKIFEWVGKRINKTYDFLIHLIDSSGSDGKLGLQFTPYYIVLIFAVFFFIWIPLNPHGIAVVAQIVATFLPFVLPFLLGTLMNEAMSEYGWLHDYSRRDYVVFEVQLPDEIAQGPYAMELVLRGLYQTGEINTWWDYFTGVTKAWFSLEIVSTEGRVRFFIWGRRSYKELIQNQVYANYPTVQLIEVEDYTLSVPFDPNEQMIWGTEERLQKEDPYPILTYNEFGTINPETKEEFKSDPMAAVIEFFGSVGEGEHLWMQFIIRAHEPSGVCPYSAGYTYKDANQHEHELHEPIGLEKWSELEINKIVDKVRGEDKKAPVNFNSLTKGDRDKIESIQAKLNKQPFDTGIRAIYIARNDKWRGAPRVGIPSAFRLFEHGSSGRGLNGLAPIFWVGPFNYPWQDFRGIRRVMLQKRYYEAYVMREFFWPPHKHPWVVLNTEELATLFHFPGRVVATPNLERMPSRRGEAPANLPV
ncbi:MAG: hypothetical protein ACREGH_04250 [Minisyncoccia bacterium]